ncbi:MarR family transcriptional regulator [Methanococcoides methylutens]|uniref:DUF7343 domain-containing protein n=1 Tax=Methanococcoides methylutens MM1 TaxID=1434104 RepID=A0A0E3WZJ9_METMT|nr:MarR family transcriptional regulator [Methanococcoides methylutens]AKB84919.1 hypothetical protein MCMEM_0866 [Methanococcoides methylutens MM1]
MEKKDVFFAIILAVSLFSLSLLLFSQGMSDLSVSLKDGSTVGVEVPLMFPINSVFLMLIMASVATYCATMFTSDIFSSGKQNLPEAGEYLSDSIVSSESFNDTAPMPELHNSATDISLSVDPVSNVENPDDTEHKKDLVARVLDGDSRKLYRIIAEKEEILQSELVLESGFSKVKVSRILKKLEDKSLIERKPYGNTNKIKVSL